MGDDAKKPSAVALNRGNWVPWFDCCRMLLLYMMLPEQLTMEFFGEGTRTFSSMNVFYSVIVGLCGWCNFAHDEYYTGLGKKPALDIVQQFPRCCHQHHCGPPRA